MVGKISLDAVVRRVDSATARIENSFGFPITLVAREDVVVEADGVEERLRFASLQGTLEDLRALERAGRIGTLGGKSAGRPANPFQNPFVSLQTHSRTAC